MPIKHSLFVGNMYRIVGSVVCLGSVVCGLQVLWSSTNYNRSMPEDLKLSQIGSSQLPPPFRGPHSPGVRKHCQIILFLEIVYSLLQCQKVGRGKG